MGQGADKKAGVPSSAVDAASFMMVSADLVRTLGGANDAILWARIHFRANGPDAHRDTDGNAWWAGVSQTQIADETGLSRDQVKRVTARLVRDGFIAEAQHHLAHNYDQSKSYRPIVRGGAKSPNESGQFRPMSGGESAQSMGADSPNVPIHKTPETSKKVSAAKRGHRLPDDFEVTPEMVSWARERTPLVDGQRSTEMFRNHWAAATGRNATIHD